MPPQSARTVARTRTGCQPCGPCSSRPPISSSGRPGKRKRAKRERKRHAPVTGRYAASSRSCHSAISTSASRTLVSTSRSATLTSAPASAAAALPMPALRATPGSCATALPLLARLAPDLDGCVLERRGQLAGAAQGRTQALRQFLRGVVAGVDGMDHLAPAQMGEGPVGGRHSSFVGITLAPGHARQAPADLGTGPAFRPPGAEPPNLLFACFRYHREHGETLDHPSA